MSPLISILLTLSSLGTTSALAAQKPMVIVDPESVEGRADLKVIEFLSYSPEILKNTAPGGCAQTETAPAAAAVYDCSFTEEDAPAASPTATAAPDPTPFQQKVYTLAIYTRNDNALMGLPANDTGDTFGLGASLTRKTKKGIATLDARVNLFSDQMKRNNSAWNQAMQMQENGEVAAVVYQPHSGIPQQFVDVSSLNLSYETMGRIYYYASIGYEIRITSAEHGLPPASAIQNWWHTDVLDTYYYDYMARSYKGSIVTQGDTAYVKDGYDAKPQFDQVSKSSFKATAAMGIQGTMFASCTMKGKVGFTAQTEGSQIIGPNSKLFIDGQTSATLIRKKNGMPKVNATVGGEFDAYPTNYKNSNAPVVGGSAMMELESVHRLSKSGTTMAFFMRFDTPFGRQIYHFTNNDHEAMNTFGFRFNFGH